MASDKIVAAVIEAIERGWVPDRLVRLGIQHLCRQRLRAVDQADCELNMQALREFLSESRGSRIAPAPSEANKQHYEVPTEFFRLTLGQRMKYSSCYWNDTTVNLDQAEELALEMTCRHAGIEDGQQVLDLGCGWGSLSLWIAEHYPNCQVTSLSNSHGQRKYIENLARQRGLENIRVLTGDISDYSLPAEQFDRAVSVEMFEHLRNHEAVLAKISRALRPAGRLLVHVFCHRSISYPFLTEGAQNWMGRWFFTGGIMPGDDMLLRFQRDLEVIDQWRWKGTHYCRTAEAWVANMDRRREAILEIFRGVYPSGDEERWFRRWRILFLAGAELFGMDRGQQWWVSHYLFQRRPAPLRAPENPTPAVEMVASSLRNQFSGDV